MSECGKIQELLSAMLDGEVSESEKAEIEKHVEGCPECRAMYNAFTAVSDSLNEPEEIPEGLHENIVRSVKAEGKKKKAPWKKVLPLAACLVLVIFGAFAINGLDNTADKAMTANDSSESLMADSAVSNDAAEDMEIIRFGADDALNAPCRVEADSAETACNEAYQTTEANAAEKLRELLTPAAVYDSNSDTKNSVSLEPRYTVVFSSAEGEETVQIYFAGDKAYADFGSGMFEVTGTPEEITELLN